MSQEYYIYKITCLPTQKCYIGQTQKYKTKDDKPYNYGIAGRWCDHVSSAKRSNTPLHQAIREHGLEQFTIECVEVVSEHTADEREAHWIETEHTRVPDGYNVMGHSRCKHRNATTLASAYLEKATAVELKVIKRGGTPTLVYVYITLPDTKKRLTFGQAKDASFEDALREATSVVDEFRQHGVRVINHDDDFAHETYVKVRIVPFNKTMVAVYLKPNEGQQKRVCFGGKTITFDEALENARTFVHRLSYDMLEDSILLKSQQQAATSLVGANTREGK